MSVSEVILRYLSQVKKLQDQEFQQALIADKTKEGTFEVSQPLMTKNGRMIFTFSSCGVTMIGDLKKALAKEQK